MTNIDLFNTAEITIEKRQWDSFGVLILNVTDSNGHESKITFYADNLDILNINTATIKAESF